MSLKAIDDLLVKVQQNEPIAPVIGSKPVENEPVEPVAKAESVESAESEGAEEEKLTHLEKFRKDKEEFLAKQAEDAQETQEGDQESPEKLQKPEKSEEIDEDTDDYGNKVPKGKVYTEEEVQAMIRKRLKLHHEEKQVQQQPQQQQQAEGFEHDPTNEQPWEIQLENHIKQTVQKLETEKQEAAWQAEQQRAQADFETRFTGGMSKYADFNDVVAGKPITNGIMMAARSMADPAAFIYAAAKQQPAELERISKITDPYVLAAEVGRLEERMKKARTVSKAPKPPTKTKGDVADKGAIRQSLDDLIRQDAKRKLGRR